jgi:capsular polysaccharide transport system permease protein
VSQLAILLFVRGILVGHSAGPVIDYLTYHTSAMLAFFMFRGCWFKVMDAVRANSGLLNYRQVKPMDTMITRALLEVLIEGTVFLILISALGWFGYQLFPDNFLYYFSAVALFIIMGFSWGLISACISHNRPRIEMFVRLLSFPMYLLSGVILPLSQFPNDYIKILMLNPGAQLVEMVRVGYFREYIPLPYYSVTYTLWFVFLSLSLGMVLYRLNREKLLEKE